MNSKRTDSRKKDNSRHKTTHKKSRRKHSSIFFFGLLTRRFDEKRNRWIIKANVKRIVIAVFALATFVWSAISASLIVYFKCYKKFDEMSIVDALVAPFDMSAFRIKMGEFNIRQAEILFHEKKYAEAFATLTGGVARSPNNLEARTWLAIIHANSLKNPEYASNILEAKLGKAFAERDEKYITTSILIFSECPSFKEKSFALAEKALHEKILSQKRIKDIFSVIFARKTNSTEFFKKASERFDKYPEIKRFAAKSASLKFLSTGEIQKASDILEKNSITSGEIHRIVSLHILFENSKEIDAVKIAESMLSKGKHVARIYSFMATVHSDFGNEAESWHNKRMVHLTTENRPADIFLLVEKSDIEKLEKLLIKRGNKLSIATIIKAALDCKKQKALYVCKSAIDKLATDDKVDLLLAYAEALIRFNDTQEAEKILIEISTLNKNIKKESFINDLKLLLALKTHTSNNKQIQDFHERTQPEKILSFAKMLSQCGLHRQAIEEILYAKACKPDLPNVDSMLFAEFFHSGNFQDAARLRATTKSRLPIKMLASANMTNIVSDKFIFLHDKERSCILQKTKDAKNKMQAYKSMYKF